MEGWRRPRMAPLSFSDLVHLCDNFNWSWVQSWFSSLLGSTTTDYWLAWFRALMLLWFILLFKHKDGPTQHSSVGTGCFELRICKTPSDYLLPAINMYLHYFFVICGNIFEKKKLLDIKRSLYAWRYHKLVSSNTNFLFITIYMAFIC